MRFKPAALKLCMVLYLLFMLLTRVYKPLLARIFARILNSAMHDANSVPPCTQCIADLPAQ